MTDLIRISRQCLGQLPSDIARPAFDLVAVRPGILHLGLGGFHRAHMARYTHDLMSMRPRPGVRSAAFRNATLFASPQVPLIAAFCSASMTASRDIRPSSAIKSIKGRFWI